MASDSIAAAAQGRFAPIEAKPALDPLAVSVMVALCVCWGLNQVAIKVAEAGIPPVLQAGLRSAGAGVLLLCWMRARRIPLLDRDGSLWPGLAVGALFGVEFLLFYVGLDLTTVSRGVVFLYSAPFWVAIGAHLFLPDDRLSPMKLAGLAAAFAGLLLAFADGLHTTAAHGTLLGDGLCLMSAMLWGATTLVVKGTRLVAIRAEKTLFYQLGVSAVMLLPASLLMGERGIAHADWLVLGALAYQIVLVAFASYVAWFWLMMRYPASLLSSFSFLAPVLGVGFGALLLGDHVGPTLGAAVALIAGGIYVVNRPARRVRKPARC
ncbi:MAG TPA: DMT family transporter [Acetobacteraceae bacterium]|nr:DMT family transporter [Acetobacteraceae bacterium]